MNQASETKDRYCHNCHYPLSPHGDYCTHCSQKYGDGRITVWALIKEYAESFLNFDSKIFLTIGHLFIPGKLTNEFFLGHHKRYVSPLRIFVIMALIHFAVLGFLINTGFEELSQFSSRPASYAHKIELMEDFVASRDSVQKEFPQQVVSTAMDSLFSRIEDPRKFKQSSSYIAKTDTGYIFKSIEMPGKLFYEAPVDSLADVNGVKGFLPRMVFIQQIKIMRNGGSFAQFIFGKMLWMVLLMMPALSFILKLLYIRRKKYFVEHLIFSFHYHAFAFFMVSIVLIIGNLAAKNSEDDLWALFAGWASLYLMVYLFMAMRRVYLQGFLKTFFKFSVLNFSYIFVFITCLSLIILISAMLF